MRGAPTCLQAPHGPTYWSFISAQIAMLGKLRTPLETAWKMADLSAQFVRPKERFSTLHPEMIVIPSSHSSAAPTGKLLYGQ